MKRAKRQLQFFALTVSVGSIALIAFYIFGIVGNNNHITKLQTQLQNYQNVKYYFEQNAEAITVFQQTVDSLKQEKIALEQKIATIQEIPLILEETARLFQTKGVQVIEGKPGIRVVNQTEQDSLIAIPIQWKITGQFISIATALEEFPRLGKRQWPEAFRAVRSPKRKGSVNAELRTRVWIRGTGQ